ncbi:MAG: hypothetical protein ACI88A_000656 [Paraglaciecola sp.]|jgi:hypothetical protein
MPIIDNSYRGRLCKYVSVYIPERIIIFMCLLKRFIVAINTNCKLTINTFSNQEIYGLTTYLAIFNILLSQVGWIN